MSKTYRKKRDTHIYGRNSSLKHYQALWLKGELEEETYGYYLLELYDFDLEKHEKYIFSDRYKRFPTKSLKMVKQESNKRNKTNKKKIINKVLRDIDIEDIPKSSISEYKKNILMWIWCY